MNEVQRVYNHHSELEKEATRLSTMHSSDPSQTSSLDTYIKLGKTKYDMAIARLKQLDIAQTTEERSALLEERSALLVNLREMDIPMLHRRAKGDGVDVGEIDEASVADDPKKVLISLIVTAADARSRFMDALKKQARAAGVDEDAIYDASVADDPKKVLLSLIVTAQKSAEEPGP